MGILTVIKARNAAAKQAKGEVEEALKLYREAIAEGLADPRYVLSFSVLLLRQGQYQEARELLVKAQKYPMTEEQRTTLTVNYACAVYKQGDLQKAIDVLEGRHRKQPSGLVYETLGYLYVEAGDADKAIAYNEEALEYDDEDSITLDNMAQAHYRLTQDKAKAREYFERALALKPGQIDTLYFLAQYDIQEGKKDEAREKLEKALEGRFSPLNFASREKVQKALDSL
ncbi:MAG: tetratricopeptide repeat protein [Clostridiales bacterium]|nr:tetratricopeptide repeat protein [Clostridiales bacterium]